LLLWDNADLNTILVKLVESVDKRYFYHAIEAVLQCNNDRRIATIFRRAVNPLEAPGYADQILFPIDLALIKKMAVCRAIGTFEDVYQHIGLICHNCVKFNVRDSE
jgi:hypothetical protein